MNHAADVSIGICICTRNRPNELRRALHSVVRSSLSPAAVVVADDSTDEATAVLVQECFPGVIYLRGPRRGLGANRNAALRHARGTHVLFIDDDVELASDFLQRAASFIGSSVPRMILSGVERQHGETIAPSKLTFLGYQSEAYRPDDAYETIVINATVFPRRLFARIQFDENLIYGCDEMDIAARAVKLHSYIILFQPELSNIHYPASSNREYYATTIEASRIYVTFKRYAWVERRRLKALIFLMLAYVHSLAHHLRRDGWTGPPAFLATLRHSLIYIAKCAAAPEKYV